LSHSTQVLHIRVKDNGPGIADGELQQVLSNHLSGGLLATLSLPH